VKINESKILGLGSGGTVVFEGEFRGRAVAVKRMLVQHNKVANKEIQFLQKVDLHPNLITYFDKEEDDNFVYLVLEKCEGNLDHLVHLLQIPQRDRNKEEA